MRPTHPSKRLGELAPAEDQLLYVPALQNHKGELDALRASSEQVRKRSMPLVQVLGPKKKPGPLSTASVKEWMKKLSGALGTSECFLDIVRLQADKPAINKAGATLPVLTVLFDAANNRGIQFVPVLPLGAKSLHVDVVAKTALIEERGVAFRVPVFGSVFRTDETLGALLSRMVGEVDQVKESVDLLLDLNFIAPDVDVDADDVVKVVDEVAAEGNWRRVVLLGTSMPPTLSVISAGQIGCIPRREWQIWQDVVNRRPNLNIVFGDYAIQNPKPPTDPGGPGMYANIRYTGETNNIIARGQSLLQEGYEQYRLLCTWLTQHAEFMGEQYSWGDGEIAKCAAGILRPGAQEMWRGIGTSHHMQFVIDQIKSLRV